MEKKVDEIKWKREILKIARGARNGFYYGFKVRCMHSLVMAFLSPKGNFAAQIKHMMRMSGIHASKLALFITIYKSSVFLLNILQRKKKKIHTFIAGCIGGFLVYRNDTSNINVQLILYLLSRDITAGLKILQNKNILPRFEMFIFLTVISWGLVMFIYKIDRKVLQKSLMKSMDYLYSNSEKIQGWTDFVPFYISAKTKI